PARRKSLGLDQTLDPRSSVATRLTPRVKLRRLRPWTLVLMLLGGLALAGYGVWEQYRPPSHLRALPAVGSTESPRQADQTVDVKPLVEPSEPPLIDHSDSKVDEPSGERGRPAAGAKPARRARSILDRQASEPSPPTPATPGVEQPEPATGSESGEPTENNDDLDYMVDPFAD
ncbi:MAG: hypothetical protein KJO07_17700, partial [Deltaproteobacteria bacterium]|nr:hypothetical protein [Deltaproteobacteria bacterium]